MHDPRPHAGTLDCATYTDSETSFLDFCERLGYVYGERRWRHPLENWILTWDSLHGEIEAFDSRGRHLSVLDALTGARIKHYRPGRRIRV